MSNIRVWFITPGMDVHYDQVCRQFPPSTTVGEVARKLHEQWHEENDQQWVAVYKHEVLNDMMSVYELKNKCQGKKLKILLVNLDDVPNIQGKRRRVTHDDGSAKVE